MDRSRKSACFLPADSFRYEIRKVQNYGLILAPEVEHYSQSKENEKDFQRRDLIMSGFDRFNQYVRPGETQVDGWSKPDAHLPSSV
jgi:hypothetical protein